MKHTCIMLFASQLVAMWETDSHDQDSTCICMNFTLQIAYSRSLKTHKWHTLILMQSLLNKLFLASEEIIMFCCRGVASPYSNTHW